MGAALLAFVFALSRLLRKKENQRQESSRVAALSASMKDAKTLMVASQLTSRQSRTMIKVKLVVTWMQILCSFNTSFDIPWPPGFVALLKVMRSIVQFDVFTLVELGGLGCYLPTTFYASFIGHMAMFPVLLGCIMAAVLLSRCRRELAIKVVLFLMFLVYPGLCVKIFRMYKCIDVGG